jgi:hypothetical protein
LAIKKNSMNRNELKYKLDKLNVFIGFYSLEGELLPDRIVLFHNYDIWEVFYFDERGNRNNEKLFSSENEACKYIYEHFKQQKAMAKKN